jgi:hypothetical protein
MCGIKFSTGYFMMKRAFICTDIFPRKITGTGVLLINELPHNYVNVNLWCAMNAKLIAGPIFYTATIKFDRCENTIGGILRAVHRRGTIVSVVSAGFSNCPHRTQFPGGFGGGVW